MEIRSSLPVTALFMLWTGAHAEVGLRFEGVFDDQDFPCAKCVWPFEQGDRYIVEVYLQDMPAGIGHTNADLPPGYLHSVDPVFKLVFRSRRTTLEMGGPTLSGFESEVLFENSIKSPERFSTRVMLQPLPVANVPPPGETGLVLECENQSFDGWFSNPLSINLMKFEHVFPESIADAACTVGVFTADPYVGSLFDNEATVSFIPPLPREIIEDLRDQISQINSDRNITSPDAKFNFAIAAIRALNANNLTASLKNLYRVIDATEMERGSEITDSQADEIILLTQTAIKSLLEFRQ